MICGLANRSSSCAGTRTANTRPPWPPNVAASGAPRADFKKRRRVEFIATENLESNPPPGLGRQGGSWSHEFLNGLKDGFKLGVVALFHFRELSSQTSIRRQHLAQLHKRAHDPEVNHHRPLAAQYTRQHGYALFGEGVRQIPSASPEFFRSRRL